MVSDLAISAVMVMLVLLGVSLLLGTIALVLLRFRQRIAAAIVGIAAVIGFAFFAWVAAAIYLS